MFSTDTESPTTITIIPEQGTDLGPKTIDLAMMGNSLTICRLLEGQDPSDPFIVRFESKVVSRTHCKITIGQDNKFYIQDKGSAGGTMLNGKPLGMKGKESELQILNDNALVQLGEDAVVKDGESKTEKTHSAVRFRVKLPPTPPTAASS